MVRIYIRAQGVFAPGLFLLPLSLFPARSPLSFTLSKLLFCNILSARDLGKDGIRVKRKDR